MASSGRGSSLRFIGKANRFGTLLWALPCLAVMFCASVAAPYLFPDQSVVALVVFSNVYMLTTVGIILLFLRTRGSAARESGADDYPGEKVLRRLQESEERYRLLVENFLCPVVIFQGSRIKFVNQVFCSLTGYTPEEVMAGDFDVFSVVHEDDRHISMNNVAALLNGETIKKPPELRFVKKSGEIITGLTFSSLIHLDGKPAIETMVIDITRAKEMERELNTTRKRLQYFLDNAPVMIFNLDRQGNFSYANKETLKVTGYSIDEWKDQSFIPIVHPEDLPLAVEKFEESRQGVKRHSYNLRIRDAEGEEKLLRINSRTLREDSEFAGALIIAQDITERHRLEKQHERDKEFIDQMIESANAMIGVTDERGRFIVFNRRFEEVTGFTKEEALGKTAFELYLSEESHELVLEKVRQGSPIHQIEIPIVSKRGDPLVVTWSGARMKLPSGKDGIVVVGQDVTEQKRMQEELVQSKKLAGIGELVSGVAHELNNPLTVVLGYSQMLSSDREISGKHAEIAQRISDAAARSKRIVENLLAFSRKQKLEKHEININELIESTLTLREHNFAVNNVQIVRHYDDSVPTTYGDGHQLQQVLLNLINNAFDAMHETNRGGMLEVRTYRNNGKVVLEVIDDGPGVPESAREKIFDPFFTTKEVGKGTGLGMSLSYGIMKEHGGTIYLDKAHNGGSKFVIELPISESPATSDSN